MLVVWELRALCGVDAPNIAVLSPVWLVYYLFGLEWERWRAWLKDREGAVAVVACVALALQVGEGFLWNGFGDYGMATTQLRLTNVVSSMGVIAFLMLASERARERLARCRALVFLGDLSFGVYLCHVVFIMVAQKGLDLIGFEGSLPSFVLWMFVLGMSVLLVIACQRVLPHGARAVVFGSGR